MVDVCEVCPIVIPPYVDPCEIVGPLTAGYAGYAIIKCGTVFTLPTSAAEWGTKKTAGTIGSTLFRDIIGQRPISTAVTVDSSSCCPPQLVTNTHTIEMIDRNAQDPTIGSAQVAWYNSLKRNYRKYQFAAIRCNELVEIVPACFAFSAVQTVENKDTGTVFWTVNVSWNAFDEIVPIYVPGIIQALLNA